MNRIDLARDLVITLKGLCFFPIFQWNTQIPAKWLSNETTLPKCPSDHNICPPQIHKLSIQIKSGFCTNRWALLIVDLRNPNGTGHSCAFPSCHTSKSKIWIYGDKTRSCSHQAQWRCRLCPQGAYHLLAIIKIQEHNSGVWNRSECHKRYQHETGYRKAQLGPTYTN